MSNTVTDFVHSWVAEHVNADAYDPGHAVIAAHVAQLTSDAAAARISVDQIEESFGDLSDFIGESLEAATDNEVDRLASRDD